MKGTSMTPNDEIPCAAPSRSPWGSDYRTEHLLMELDAAAFLRNDRLAAEAAAEIRRLSEIANKTPLTNVIRNKPVRVAPVSLKGEMMKMAGLIDGGEIEKIPRPRVGDGTYTG